MNYDGAQYPVREEPLPNTWVSVQTQDLERIFPALRRCAAKNDARTFLNGTHWQIRRVGQQDVSLLVLEATDGHRAARFSLEYTPPLDSVNSQSGASADTEQAVPALDAILPVEGLSAWMKLLSSRKNILYCWSNPKTSAFFMPSWKS